MCIPRLFLVLNYLAWLCLEGSLLCIYEHWILKITVFEIVCCQYVPLSTNSLTGALEAWESQPVIRGCKLLFKLTLIGVQKSFAFMFWNTLLSVFPTFVYMETFSLWYHFFQIECSSKSDGCSWADMLKKDDTLVLRESTMTEVLQRVIHFLC